MLDRLLYRNQWFDLPNQRPVEECYWVAQHLRKPLVGLPPHPLRENEYACDWKIERRRLWLLSIVLDEDGSDLLFRLLPGVETPIVADWYSGSIDANGESFLRKGLREVPIVRFTIESGRILQTEHFDIPPQFGWDEEEPSLRVRKDWKQAPK